MTRKSLIFLLLVLASLCTASLYAGTDGTCEVTATGVNCPLYNFVTDFYGDPAAGGNYQSCSANGAAGQMCQAIDMDPISRRYECASVQRSAKCNCDPKTLTATGTCTYLAR